MHRSFYDFFLVFWAILYPTTPLKKNWHLKYLCDEAQRVIENLVPRNPKLFDLLISIAPGETKSTIFSRLLPVWAWLRDPTLRLITGSHSSSLANDLTLDSRDILQNPMYRQIVEALARLKELPEYAEELKDFRFFNLKKDQNVKSNYRNDQGGGRYAASAGGKFYGKHADLIIIDDSVEPPDPSKGIGIDQADVLQGINMISKMSTRKTDKKVTVTIVVQQRVGRNDVSKYVINSHRKLKHICLPMVLNERVEPEELTQYYSPEGYMNPFSTDEKVIEELIQKLGLSGFNAQCLQDPSDTTSSIWQRKWFAERFRLADLPDTAVFHTVTDTASTDKQKNSPTGFLSYAYHEGKYYVRLFRAVWVKEPDLYTEYLRFLVETGYHHIQSRAEVEPKANGISFVNNLRNEQIFNLAKNALQEDLKTKGAPPELQQAAAELPLLNLIPFENVEIGEKPSNTAKGTSMVRFLSMSKEEKARHVASVIQAGRLVLLAEDEMKTLYQTDWEQVLTAAEDFPQTHIKEVIDLISYMIVRHETPLKERFYHRLHQEDFGFLFDEGDQAPKPSAPLYVFWSIQGTSVEAITAKMLYEEEKQTVWVALFDHFQTNSLQETTEQLQAAYHDQTATAFHYHLQQGSATHLHLRRKFARNVAGHESIFNRTPKIAQLATSKSKRIEQLENLRPFINALLSGDYRIKMGNRRGWKLQLVADTEAKVIVEAFEGLYLDLSNVDKYGETLNAIAMGVGQLLEGERMVF